MSGRSPLTLALRVGDHMMFVQLQLAAQHAPLQHRHVLAAAAAAAARGDSNVNTPVSSPCRPVSSAARVPPLSSSPSPVSPAPVTAGSFRSHAASTACSEVRMPTGSPGGGSSSLRWFLTLTALKAEGIRAEERTHHSTLLPISTSRWAVRHQPAAVPHPPQAAAQAPAPANPVP